MPWKLSTMKSQRSQFILESRSGSYSHSELCRKFSISRRTGYKWISRFKEEGITGLLDRSKRPTSSKSEIQTEILTKIVSYRTAHQSWGATKIHIILKREFKNLKIPSRRTIHRILQDCNLVKTRQYHSRRKAPQHKIVLKATHCNHIWTVDFKGWWRTNDGKKVYPLTIRDEFSKFILGVYVLGSPNLELVKQAFIDCFTIFGLPEYIRSDNGTPFSFSQGFCGLSRLSAWWLKLGVIPNFIPPASPQYNAAHERMHLDMAKDMEEYPARNLKEQQDIATQWKHDYNFVRPHDALGGKTPSKVYRKSNIKYNIAEPSLEYPEHLLKRYVNRQGIFKFAGKRVFISKAIGGENIGIEYSDDHTIYIHFGHVKIAQMNMINEEKPTEIDLISKLTYSKKRAA